MDACAFLMQLVHAPLRPAGLGPSQLEEVCVGAVRRMEEAAAPSLGPPMPSALQAMASNTSGLFGSSGGGAGPGAGAGGGLLGGALSLRSPGAGLASAVSAYGGLGGGLLGSANLSGAMSQGSPLGDGFGGGGGRGAGGGGGGGGGGGRLPPGMANEIAENVSCPSGHVGWDILVVVCWFGDGLDS